MTAFKIGREPVLAVYRGSTELWRWSPADLFIGGGSGFWAGGFAPAPWTPAAAFTTGAGFWLGGVQPEGV